MQLSRASGCSHESSPESTKGANALPRSKPFANQKLVFYTMAGKSGSINPVSLIKCVSIPQTVLQTKNLSLDCFQVNSHDLKKSSHLIQLNMEGGFNMQVTSPLFKCQQFSSVGENWGRPMTSQYASQVLKEDSARRDQLSLVNQSLIWEASSDLRDQRMQRR